MSQFKDEVMHIVLKWYPDCRYIEIKVDKSFKTLPASVDVRVVE